MSKFSWLCWSEREERCLYVSDLVGNGAWRRKVKMKLWFQIHLRLWIIKNSTVPATRAYNYGTVDQGIIVNDHQSMMLVGCGVRHHSARVMVVLASANLLPKILSSMPLWGRSEWRREVPKRSKWHLVILVVTSSFCCHSSRLKSNSFRIARSSISSFY